LETLTSTNFVPWINSIFDLTQSSYEWINSNFILSFFLAQFFSAIIRKAYNYILEIAGLNFNLPSLFYFFSDKFTIPKFHELEGETQSNDISISSPRTKIRGIYQVSKSLGLIGRFNEPYLSKTAFNSNDAISQVFFEKSLSKAKPVFREDQNQEKLELFSGDFELICGKYISSSQARLYIHCVGGMYGGIYTDNDYCDMINIASKMTLDNVDLIETPQVKLNKFLLILKNLIYSSDSQDDFVLATEGLIIDLIANNPTYKTIDIKLIVKDTLLKAILLSKQV
jgi:hypothetical protein